MKTKREWLASAAILLGSGSILSAAALATTPSTEKNATANTTATFAAVATDAMNVSDDAVQSAADESTVQVVTGDLKKNELYIFADNQVIPEKVIDENPDATIAILGADEKKAAEKIERFTKTAKIVATRREKARIVAMVQAEADNQKLRDWHGGMVELSLNHSVNTKSALPIEQHLYPRTIQLAKLPEVILSASDDVKVRKAMQQSVDINQETQTLSLSDLDSMAYHSKIELPAYRGVQQRHTQLTELFTAKIHQAIAAIRGVPPLDKADVAPAPMTSAEVTAKSLRAPGLHRYTFRLPSYLNVMPVVPTPEIITAANIQPVSVASVTKVASKEITKSVVPAPAAKPVAAATVADAAPVSNHKLTLPLTGLHRYAFHLPEHLNMNTVNEMAVVHPVAVKDAPAVAVVPAINANSTAIAQAAVAARAILLKPATPSQVGVMGSAFEGAHLAMSAPHKPSALSLANQLQRKSVLVSDTLNVALLAPQIKIPHIEKQAAPAPRILLAEKLPTVVKSVTPGSAQAAVKIATAAGTKAVSAKASELLRPAKTLASSAKIKNTVADTAAEYPVKRIKVTPKKISNQQYKTKIKSHYVAARPVHHVSAKVSAKLAQREHALSALERQLAAEPEPQFHPQRVATKRIDEPRPAQEENNVERYPAHPQQTVSAQPDYDETPRPQRQHGRRDYEMASVDNDSAKRAAEKRYRKWSNPAEFSKMMME